MPRLGSLSSRSLTGIGLLLRYNNPQVPPPIGVFWDAQGGYYGGVIASVAGSSVATHWLIVSPKELGEGAFQFRTSNATWPTSTSNNSGYLATNNYATDPTFTAAVWARAQTINGFNDWYIPAIKELEILFYNLKPTTEANNTSSTDANNQYAVPNRSGTFYSANIPSQTSVTAFQQGGSQAFSTIYHSSWQGFANSNIVTSFVFSNEGSGFQPGQEGSGSYFSTVHNVRLIRRVAI